MVLRHMLGRSNDHDAPPASVAVAARDKSPADADGADAVEVVLAAIVGVAGELEVGHRGDDGGAGRARPLSAAADALRVRFSLCATRAMREGSLRRFVANRVSVVVIGGRARGVCALCVAMRNKDRTPPPRPPNVLQMARGSRRSTAGTAEQASGGVADRARSPHCPGRAERQARAETARARRSGPARPPYNPRSRTPSSSNPT
jgi:hypothetical protein